MSTLPNIKSQVLELFFSIHVSPPNVRRKIRARYTVLSPLCELLLQFFTLSKIWNKRVIDSIQELWRNESRGQAMYLAKDFVHRKQLGSQAAVQIIFNAAFSYYSDVFGVTGALSIVITDRAPRDDAKIAQDLLVEKLHKLQEAGAEDEINVKVRWAKEPFLSIKSTLFTHPWPAILDPEGSHLFGMKAFFFGDEQEQYEEPGTFRICCQKIQEIQELKLLVLALDKELNQEQSEGLTSEQRVWIAERIDANDLGSARKSETFSLYVPVRSSLTGGTIWVKITATWENYATF